MSSFIISQEIIIISRLFLKHVFLVACSWIQLKYGHEIMKVVAIKLTNDSFSFLESTPPMRTFTDETLIIYNRASLGCHK